MPASKKGECQHFNILRLKTQRNVTDCARKSSNLFSQFTGFFWGVEDLIEEDGEVKCQAQADGMCGVHLSLADVKCFLVRLL